jgi:hypothetical protein
MFGLGETIDRIVTYSTPVILLFKEFFGKLATNPEIQKKTTEELIKVAKGGRTRGDEFIFLASFKSFKGASTKNKQLFSDKHYELLNPDLANKTDEREIKSLKKKKALAKGLIFLISEDRSCIIHDPRNPTQPGSMFQMAHKIWGTIFMGIRELTDDEAKLKIFEKRILYFGKNHQEGKTLKQIIFSSLETIPEGIKSGWQKIKEIDSDLAGKIPEVQKDPGFIKGVFGFNPFKKAEKRS